jgi:hypothetical protein
MQDGIRTSAGPCFKCALPARRSRLRRSAHHPPSHATHPTPPHPTPPHPTPPHPPHRTHPTPPHPPQNPGGQSSNCEAQPPPATNQGRQRSNTGAQHQVSQSSPKGSLGDWCWGARFLQAPAGKVIGLLRFSAETEVLGRRAGEGVQRRGVGGRKPRPIRGFSTLRSRVDGF